MTINIAGSSTYISEAGKVTGFGHLSRVSALIDISSNVGTLKSWCVLDDMKLSYKRAQEMTSKTTEFVTCLGVLENTNFRHGIAYVDGARIDIDALHWKDVEICVVMSPLVRIPRFRSASFFRGRTLPTTWKHKKGDVIGLGREYAVVPTYVSELRKQAHPKKLTHEGPFVLSLMLGEHPSEKAWTTVKNISDELLKFGNLEIRAPEGVATVVKHLLKMETIDRLKIVSFQTSHSWNEISSSDLVVATAGQSLVESLCLGMPTIAIPTHEVHAAFVRELLDFGACLEYPIGGLSSTQTMRLVHRILSDDDRCDLAQKAQAAIDGQGAYRIHEAIQQMAF